MHPDDFDDDELDDLAAKLAPRLPTGTHGDRVILPRRAFMGAMGGALGVGALTALGVDEAAAQAAGSQGTADEPNNMFAWDLNVANSVTSSLPMDGNDIENAGSVSTDDLQSAQGAVGGDLSLSPVEVTSDYDQEPNLAQLSNGTLVLLWREGTAHGVSDGRLVCKRSDDLGESWSSKIEVVNDGQDDRNPSMVHDTDSDRLIVFYRSYDSGGSFEDIYYVTSDDGGKTWSGRTAAPTTNTPIAAFGGGVSTSNGLMTCLITENDSGERVIEVIFSTDGGQSWGSNVEVINSSDVSWTAGNVISEPVPAKVDDDRLLCFVRDDRRSGDHGGHVVVKSDDGGSTWDAANYEYINPLVNDYATFLRLRSVANQLVGVAAVRGPNQESDPVRSFEIPAELAFQDPGKIDTHAKISELSETVGSDGMHTGYPDLCLTANSLDGALVAYMDDTNDNGEPDVYFGSYSAGENKANLFDDCSVELSESQSVPSGDWTTLAFDDVGDDENGGFDTANNQYVAQQAGKFHIKGQAHPMGALFSQGDRYIIRIRKNDTQINRKGDQVQEPDGFTADIEYREKLEKGDTIDIQVFHDSGVSIDIDDDERSHFQITQYRR